MSYIKLYFDVRDLPRAKNAFRAMQSMDALERMSKPEPKTAIESRSVENKTPARGENREKALCGQCGATIFADEICDCMEVKSEQP